MKTAAQERQAIAERQANADAKAAGLPLPYPNPWDRLLPKLAEDATPEERIAWHRAFAERHMPRP